MALEFQISEDGMKVMLPELPVSTAGGGGAYTTTDMSAELEQQNIVEGIKWLHIDKALERSVKTGSVVHNVLIAEATPPEVVLQFEGENAEYAGKKIKALKDSMNTLEAFVRQEEVDIGNGFRFFGKGDVIFIGHWDGQPTNVLGEPISLKQFGPLAQMGRAIEVNVQDDETVFCTARVPGYLYANPEKGLFDLFPLESRNEDNSRLFMNIVPAASGRSQLEMAYLKYKDLPTCVTEGRIKPLNEALDASGYVRLLVCEGQPSKKGSSARLERKVVIQDKPDMEKFKDQDQINYWELSPFLEVEKGEVLVVKHPAEESHPGVDIFGNAITPPTARDIQFLASKNVREQVTDDGILYVATATGIVFFEGNGVWIEETLEIPGNVGPTTGYIKFSGDVVIGGNISATFKVQAGGDVTVHRSVEAGCEVVCGGNLIIAGGVLGQDTKLNCGGDLSVDYIQGSRVECGGNMVVQNILFHAQVYCRGSIEVKGEKRIRGDSGSVAGGHVHAKGNMVFHSMGARNALTTIAAGVDMLVLEEIEELNDKNQVIIKQQEQIQDKIGFDLASRDLAHKLKTLAPARKKIVKELLASFFAMTAELKNISTRQEELQEEMYASNLQEIDIRIENVVYPEVKIQMGRSEVRHITELVRAGIRFKAIQVDKKGEKMKIVDSSL